MIRFSPRPNSAHKIRWREWGQAAFDEARQQDKPLAVFITAFWCGFCQRMDETSLSDEQVIAILDGLFIPVRLEESQRPDVDLRYNQDGWPTIAFMTPGGTHLASVNYTPPDEFLGLLARVVDFYQQNGESLNQPRQSDQMDTGGPELPSQPAPLGPELEEEIAGMLEGLADPDFGGFGGDLKMLHTEANAFFMTQYVATGDDLYLDHVRLTLDRLSASATFDRRDGGFFRYSSRRDWQEPHPEKLLDDQALLLRNYLEAYLLTDESAYREAAEGLVDYMSNVLSGESSLPFFSGCQDYVRLAPDSDPTSLIDTLVYCDANAHAASAFLDAWWLLGRDDCGTRAASVLDGLWQRFRAADGSMFHYWDGSTHAPGLLQDMLAAGLAFLDGYVALGSPTHIQRAREIADRIVEDYRGIAGGFVDISRPGPANLSVPLTLLTQNATAAKLLVRLADLADAPSYRRWARWALRRFPNSHREHGAFAAGFGHALSLLHAEPVCVTITGKPGDTKTRDLLRTALQTLRLKNPVIRYEQARPGEAPLLAVKRSGEVIGRATEPDQIARWSGPTS